MDDILKALAHLLGVFTEPIQVVLIFIIAGLSVALYMLAKFILGSYKEGIQNDLRNAQALEGVRAVLEKVATNGKP